MIEGLLQDVRYAFRSLRFSPGFVFVAIASLALGTGANTAIFQLLDAIRLRSLPVRAPEELVELRTSDMENARGSWMRAPALTNPQWEAIRSRQDPFQGMLAWADESFQMAEAGESNQAAGLWVSGDFFRVLGVNPVLGRVFSVNDDRRGCGFAPGAVISYGFWQREFGGDAAVVGKPMRIGRNKIEVAGVTPRDFFGLEVGKTFDIALPICTEPAVHGGAGRLDSGTTWWLTVIGRLKTGGSMAAAQAFFDSQSPEIFQTTLPKGYPTESVKSYLAMKLVARPAGDGLSQLRDTYSRPLILLLAIAGLVLLVACANLANLMLARASARQHEVALRLAVGASPLRIAQQGIVESLLLALAGAGLGLAVARSLSGFLVAFMTSADEGIYVDLSPDSRVFAFTAGLAIVTCAVFAFAPVLRMIGTDAGDALKASGRTMTSGRGGARFRRFLVASQIAISLVLLAGTLLFARSLRNLKTLDAGFEQHGLLFADVTFSRLQARASNTVQMRKEVLQRVRALPGVEGATELGIVPLSGGNWDNRIWMDDSDRAHARVAMRNIVGPQYFSTFKTALVAGRGFEERDLNSEAKVAVVNEEFVRLFNGGRNVVGRRLWVEATPYEPQTALEIVGVAKNSKYRNLREEFPPMVFVPLSQAFLKSSHVQLMIRSGVSPEALVSALRKTIAAVSPDAQYSFRVFDTWVEESLLRERLMATLSTVFGLLASILTAVGVYGVTAYGVTLRTTEIGIRIALGADRNSVMGLILREAAFVSCAGLAIGTVLALALGRAAATLLFGMQANDPLTIGAAGTLLFAMTMIASGWPAWRAFRTNPAVELRQN